MTTIDDAFLKLKSSSKLDKNGRQDLLWEYLQDMRTWVSEHKLHFQYVTS